MFYFAWSVILLPAEVIVSNQIHIDLSSVFGFEVRLAVHCERFEVCHCESLWRTDNRLYAQHRTFHITPPRGTHREYSLFVCCNLDIHPGQPAARRLGGILCGGSGGRDTVNTLRSDRLPCKVCDLAVSGVLLSPGSPGCCSTPCQKQTAGASDGTGGQGLSATLNAAGGRKKTHHM